MTPEQYDDALAAGAGQKPGQRLKKRQISLAGSVLFDTGAAAHQQIGMLPPGGMQE